MYKCEQAARRRAQQRFRYAMGEIRALTRSGLVLGVRGRVFSTVASATSGFTRRLSCRRSCRSPPAPPTAWRARARPAVLGHVPLIPRSNVLPLGIGRNLPARGRQSSGAYPGSAKWAKRDRPAPARRGWHRSVARNLTRDLTSPLSVSGSENKNPAYAGFSVMGVTGIEPVTSRV